MPAESSLYSEKVKIRNKNSMMKAILETQHTRRHWLSGHRWEGQLYIYTCTDPAQSSHFEYRGSSQWYYGNVSLDFYAVECSQKANHQHLMSESKKQQHKIAIFYCCFSEYLYRSVEEKSWQYLSTERIGIISVQKRAVTGTLTT